MKLKFGKVYGCNQQQFLLIPETKAELRMLSKIQGATLSGSELSGSHPHGWAFSGQVLIAKKGMCQKCKNSHSAVDGDRCVTCKRNPNLWNQYHRRENKPTAADLLIKGLIRAGKQRGRK